VQVADLRNEPPVSQEAVPVQQLVLEAGYRARMIVPLLGANRVVGALVVRRKTPGEFPKTTVDLLQTFAAQSVLAIQNQDEGWGGARPVDRSANRRHAWRSNPGGVRNRRRLDVLPRSPGQRRTTSGERMTKRILVVEDQEDNRRIVRDLLRHAGFEVIEVGDGEQALSATAAQRPDVILMDIQLPHLDGYEATRRIKANPVLKHIPIIVVTSYALSGDEAKARAAGCDAYMAKPLSSKALLAKIREYAR
jgi:two-component system cell cycle response regulator DivK